MRTQKWNATITVEGPLPIVIGLDPGVSGGMCIRYPDGKVTTTPMPDTLSGIIDMLPVSQEPQVQTVVYMEKVGGFIPGRPQPGSAMFNFGKNYGALQAACMMNNFTIRDVTPQSWQKSMKCGSKSQHAEGAWKRHLQDMARRLCPESKPTLKTADAVLLMLYGVKDQKGER